MAAGGLLLLPMAGCMEPSAPPHRVSQAAGVEPRTMPMPSTPDPREIALDILEGMEIAVREGDLAAARQVLDKHRETIEKMRRVLAESTDQIASRRSSPRFRRS